ncbi:MAG TPA: glycosyltransferase, partial [Bacteroidia bacterium]|nr:glycosyltransferase [Bacteroidia bacterium]
QQFSYKPLIDSRNKLNLPPNETVVLFVANDVNNMRKGIQFIIVAANKSKHKFYGIGKPDANLPSCINQLGYLTPEELQWWYVAANVFVLPSLAENFPNTICESLCCGTPVVAFNTGGIPELIDNNNGVLIPDFNATQLLMAIDNCIANNQHFNRKQIASDADKKLSSTTVLQMHITLYQSVLC